MQNYVSRTLESEVRNWRLVTLATVIVCIALALGIAAIVLATRKCESEPFVGKIPRSEMRATKFPMSKFQPVATDPYLVGAKQNPQIDQPQAFEHQLLSSGCLPYVGCLYPMPNPINIKTGRRDNDILPEDSEVTRSQVPQGTEVRTCSKAWRDCNLFTDCVDGKCVPKKDVYKGF